MHLQIFYLPIFSVFINDYYVFFQGAKVRNISQTAKTISSKTEQGRRMMDDVSLNFGAIHTV